MTSNLILSRSEAPLSRRASPPKQKQSRSPRKSSSLPIETVDYLKAWMMSPEHIAHPYPTEQEKAKIMADTGIELKQLTNWFVNNRKRFWKPRVEAQLQNQQAAAAVSKITVSPTTTTAFIPSPSSGNQYSLAVDMTKPPRLPVTPPLEDDVVNVSAFVSFRRSRSPRAVSIGSSSFASESDMVSLSNESVDDFSVFDEVDDDSRTVKRTETVDVHILVPTGGDSIPTIEDVTILTNVPSSRILETYENCALSYQFPLEGLNNKKKAQSRRDSEIVKMKKQYLKMFLSETAAGAAGITPADDRQAASKKRDRSSQDDEVVSRRPKYLRQSPPLWRDVCRSANDIYDRELPSIEEASHLFGFSTAA